MCFDLDSEPPIATMSGALESGLVRSEELVLTALDGTKFSAFAAHVEATHATGAGIVILPDVRGLYRFYRDLALRFAEHGVEALAIDYFGRSAGLTAREDDFDYMPHVRQTTPETLAMDVASAVAYLRRLTPGAPRTIFTVGFCFGGSTSFAQAANKHGLSGVIGFYGRPASPGLNGASSPIALVNEFECPVLGLFGGADPSIPQEDVQQFDAALQAAGVAHEIISYPGAPHSFFDRKYEEFAKESADAWQRVLGFLQANTVPVAQA